MNEINSLSKNQIFVFGSNTEGKHGAGAAKKAHVSFGAIYGQPEGIQGKSYGIITKDLTNGFVGWDFIEQQIQKLFDFAEKHPELDFLLTPVGTGLAGGNLCDLEKIIRRYNIPNNVYRTWIENPTIDNMCSFLNLDQIKKIEKTTNSLYVLESCLKEKNSENWINAPFAIFYNKKPHPKGSNYLAVFVENKKINVTNGITGTESFWGLIVENKIIYSRFRHDFRSYKNCSVDGGRDYFKSFGNGIPCRIHVKEEKLIIEKQITGVFT